VFSYIRKKVTGGQRELHDEKLCNFRFSSDNIRMISWLGHLEGMGEIRGAYSILMRKPERNRPSGCRRHRFE
jgi:hypothetical protein